MDGLPILFGAVILAGVVRGFSGFGTAMIYVPLASLVLPPIWVLITMAIYDVIGPLPMIPRAVREGQPRDVLKMISGVAIGLPVGFWMLTMMEAVTFRWLASSLALGLLVLLMSGWRYRRELSTFAKAAVGFTAGISGGAAGAGGPPVILFYMSGPGSVSMIRADIMMFLVLFDVVFLTFFGATGYFTWEPIILAAFLIPPYMIAGLIGQAIFNPEKEATYRRAAYVIIAASAIAGLPLWD